MGQENYIDPNYHMCQDCSKPHNNRFELCGWTQYSIGIGSSSINKSMECPIGRIREKLTILEKDPWMIGSNPIFQGVKKSQWEFTIFLNFYGLNC